MDPASIILAAPAAGAAAGIEETAGKSIRDAYGVLKEQGGTVGDDANVTKDFKIEMLVFFQFLFHQEIEGGKI